MAYVTIFNKELNTGTEIFTVEADKPGKYVYLHLRHKHKQCGAHHCPHVDCGDAHVALTWEQAQTLGDTLSEILQYGSANHAIADHECMVMEMEAIRIDSPNVRYAVPMA